MMMTTMETHQPSWLITGGQHLIMPSAINLFSQTVRKTGGAKKLTVKIA